MGGGASTMNDDGSRSEFESQTHNNPLLKLLVEKCCDVTGNDLDNLMERVVSTLTHRDIEALKKEAEEERSKNAIDTTSLLPAMPSKEAQTKKLKEKREQELRIYLNDPDCSGYLPLYYVATSGLKESRKQEVFKLLEDRGARPNEFVDDKNMLDFAMDDGNLDSVKFLVKNGVTIPASLIEEIKKIMPSNNQQEPVGSNLNTDEITLEVGADGVINPIFSRLGGNKTQCQEVIKI